MTDTLYAKAGEKVTCTNGHLIAIASDLPRHGVATPSLFDWKISNPPKPGQSFSSCVCPECGGRYMAFGPSVALHFEDGWRGASPSDKAELERLHGG